MDWNEAGAIWVAIRPCADGLVARVCGDLDLFTVERMREQVCASIAFHGVTSLQIDLSECSFMDSAALHVLLQLDRALAMRGGGISVIACSAAAQRILDHFGHAALLAGQSAARPGPSG